MDFEEMRWVKAIEMKQISYILLLLNKKLMVSWGSLILQLKRECPRLGRNDKLYHCMSSNASNQSIDFQGRMHDFPCTAVDVML